MSRKGKKRAVDSSQPGRSILQQAFTPADAHRLSIFQSHPPILASASSSPSAAASPESGPSNVINLMQSLSRQQEQLAARRIRPSSDQYHPQPTRSGRVPAPPIANPTEPTFDLEKYIDFPSDSDSDDPDFLPQLFGSSRGPRTRSFATGGQIPTSEAEEMDEDEYVPESDGLPSGDEEIVTAYQLVAPSTDHSTVANTPGHSVLDVLDNPAYFDFQTSIQPSLGQPFPIGFNLDHSPGLGGLDMMTQPNLPLPTLPVFDLENTLHPQNTPIRGPFVMSNTDICIDPNDQDDIRFDDQFEDTPGKGDEEILAPATKRPRGRPRKDAPAIPKPEPKRKRLIIPPELREEARRERNRRLAKAKTERNKQAIADATDKAGNLQAENDQLKYDNEKLRQQVHDLQIQLRTEQSKVFRG